MSIPATLVTLVPQEEPKKEQAFYRNVTQSQKMRGSQVNLFLGQHDQKEGSRRMKKTFFCPNQEIDLAVFAIA